MGQRMCLRSKFLFLFVFCLFSGFAFGSWGCDPRRDARRDTGSGQELATLDAGGSQDDNTTDVSKTPDTGTSDDGTTTDQGGATPDTTAVDQGDTPDNGATDNGMPDPGSTPDQGGAPDKGQPDKGQPDKGQPDNPPAATTPFFLYDEDTSQFLLPMAGAVDLKPYEQRKTLNIAIKVADPRVKSVRFFFDNDKDRVESIPAFTVFSAGDHRARLTRGTHTIRAILYDGTKGTGNILSRPTTQFTVKEEISAPSSGTNLPADPTKVPPDPTFNSTKNVTQTIVITKSGTYDFKNVLHIWKGKGSCNQTENQPHILRIQASNVTVKNFAYRNAPDGIHIATCGKGQGNTCTGKISNITLDNVTGWACEDVLTTGKGTSKITIKNSFFLGNPNKTYRDKCLQINFGDDLRIEYTMFKNCRRPIRFKSGSKITLIGNRFYIFDQATKGDTFKDITGIIPDRTATVYSEKNHFQDGSTAHFAEGKTVITSVNDVFRNVRRKSEERSGGKVTIK